MEFKELVQQRFASREYEDRKIDDTLIDEILGMIRLSPSALNMQPWKIKVVEDDDLKEKLYDKSFYQSQITNCSHVLVFCANRDLPGQIEKIIKGMKVAGVPEEQINRYKTATQLVLSGSEESVLCEAQKNVYIAATQAIYAAKSLGIDSCIVQGFEPAAYSEILELPSNLVPTLLVTLGYATDSPRPKVRFPKEEIFF